MVERVIIGGFGGQGVIFLGKLLTQAMMDEGLHVTYFPAYGPEVRGGRANCHVIIASEPILCPVIAQPDALLIMNQITWDYYAPWLRPGGLAVMNSSMVIGTPADPSHRVVCVPATEIANDLGDVRSTNMVMLGAYNQVRELLPLDNLLAHLRSALGGAKAGLFELNCKAVLRGSEAVAAASERSP